MSVMAGPFQYKLKSDHPYKHAKNIILTETIFLQRYRYHVKGLCLKRDQMDLLYQKLAYRTAHKISTHPDRT